MSNLHQTAIEGICAEALMRVRPEARVAILRRLLKVAVEDAKKPMLPDPRQTSLEEYFHGSHEKQSSAPSMRRYQLPTVCVWGPTIPYRNDQHPLGPFQDGSDLLG